MRRVFNAVMRVISSLIGVLMVLMGGIWILQGLNLAWGSLSRSLSPSDPKNRALLGLDSLARSEKDRHDISELFRFSSTPRCA